MHTRFCSGSALNFGPLGVHYIKRIGEKQIGDLRAEGTNNKRHHHRDQRIDDDTCVRAFRYYDTDNSGSLDRDVILALSQSLWYVYSAFDGRNGSTPGALDSR